MGIWDARGAPDETGDDNDEEDADNREGGKYWRLQVGFITMSV